MVSPFYIKKLSIDFFFFFCLFWHFGQRKILGTINNISSWINENLLYTKKLTRELFCQLLATMVLVDIIMRLKQFFNLLIAKGEFTLHHRTYIQSWLCLTFFSNSGWYNRLRSTANMNHRWFLCDRRASKPHIFWAMQKQLN